VFPDFSLFVTNWGILGVFVFSFLLALIPFASPSNALVALFIALAFPDMNKIGIGLAVAVGATTAKTIHFFISYGAGKVIDKRRGKKTPIGKYGKATMYILNVVAAATPLPDEWIVVPMGLSGFSVIWFVATYLGGKLLITVPSAYLGNAIAPIIEQSFGESAFLVTAIIGIISTAVIVVIFIFVDVEKTAVRILKRVGVIRDEQFVESEDTR
jgi:hypothetical protein